MLDIGPGATPLLHICAIIVISLGLRPKYGRTVCFAAPFSLSLLLKGACRPLKPPAYFLFTTEGCALLSLC